MEPNTSKELFGIVGTIAGAVIGFLGGTLASFLQRGTEREKRREDRLWHYRWDLVQRLRPTWERIDEYLEWYIESADGVARALHRFTAIPDSERVARLVEIIWLIKEFKRARSDLVQVRNQRQRVMTPAKRILRRVDSRLRDRIRKFIGQAMLAMANFDRQLTSAEDKFGSLKITHGDTTTLVEQLEECRREIIRCAQQVEASIEDYVTIKETP